MQVEIEDVKASPCRGGAERSEAEGLLETKESVIKLSL